MALTTCKECGNQVSNKAKSCPNCGSAPKKKSNMRMMLLVGVAIIVASLASTFDIGRPPTNTASSDAKAKEHEDFRAHSDALYLCQHALQRASNDPEKADIPYVQNSGGESEYYFAWGKSTKMARMRNGLGLDVAVSASCIVDKTTREITSLTVNGKDMMRIP